MAELNEHLKLNKDVLGIGYVRTDKFTHQDLWSRIDEVVQDYTRLHPVEMEIIVRDNLQYSGHQFSKHGVGKNTNLEIRHHLRMPIGLLRKLEEICPELFEKRAYYHKFMKRFKGLCAYE